MSNWQEILKQNTHQLEKFLETLLKKHPKDDEIQRPERLLAAMRHGVLNGGKRLRPFLLMQVTNILNGSMDAALYCAAALEILHCYSLIHDDLPAMDNDDLRRGKPTVHKAFDEASAILAGDALLTLAFDILSDKNNPLQDHNKIKIISKISRVAGLGGMVGGQMLDMHPPFTQQNEADIITMQTMKTAQLFRFACEAGAIIAASSDEEQNIFAEFGNAIGLAFQIYDDILDQEATTHMLGKTAGKDEKANKKTLIALHGIDWTKTQCDGLIARALELLEPYGEKAEILREVTQFITKRQS